jgi:type II secretory pathway pseudopilin PulG
VINYKRTEKVLNIGYKMLKRFKSLISSKFRITSRKAFSLMEVFVCIALIMIISSSILTAIVAGNRIINRVSHRVMAMNYAREAVEELFNRGFDGLSTTVGFTSYEYALPSGDFLDNLSGLRQYEVDALTWGAEAADYKKITVRVSWTDPYSLQVKTEDYVVYMADRITIL